MEMMYVIVLFYTISESNKSTTPSCNTISYKPRYFLYYCMSVLRTQMCLSFIWARVVWMCCMRGSYDCYPFSLYVKWRNFINPLKPFGTEYEKWMLLPDTLSILYYFFLCIFSVLLFFLFFFARSSDGGGRSVSRQLIFWLHATHFESVYIILQLIQTSSAH